MGANIGTSVTITIVSLAQAAERNEFRRAFAGAVVHDIFNWLSVIILLPLEVITGYLLRLTSKLVELLNLTQQESAKKELLKVVTKPFTNLVIQLDKQVIDKVALGDKSADELSRIKQTCDTTVKLTLVNKTVTNSTTNITSFFLVNETVEKEGTMQFPLP